MLGKAARIQTRICDDIFGLVTKRNIKMEHNLTGLKCHIEYNYIDSVIESS